MYSTCLYFKRHNSSPIFMLFIVEEAVHLACTSLCCAHHLAVDFKLMFYTPKNHDSVMNQIKKQTNKLGWFVFVP